MGPRRRQWKLATSWGVLALCVVWMVVGLVLFALNHSTPVPATFGSRDAAVISNVVFLAFPVVGALIASHCPDNRLWWLFSLVGVSAALWLFADGWAVRALYVDPGSLPGGAAAAWLGNLVWVVGWGGATVMYLVFPVGELASPRWRPVLWATVAGTALLLVGLAVAPGPLRDYPYAVNPIGQSWWPTDSEAVGALTFVFFGIFGTSAVASLFVKLRHADQVERQQVKWILYSGALVIGGIAVFALLGPLGVRNSSAEAFTTFTRAAIPIAAGIAILRHRLYDIDVVISKTLVFGGMAAFITAVYAIVVAGIGTVADRGAEPNFAVSVLATGVVAVAFQPVRERLERAANRLVYGVRATPYEVLSQFSERLGETADTDRLLERMVRLLAEGTGACKAQLWLQIGDRLAPVATWPMDAPDDGTAPSPRGLPMDDGRLPPLEAVDRVAPVTHQGKLLGALTVVKPRGESMTATEDKLLADLAAQAGLVVRNVRLTAERVQRLAELRASRQRLVTAQDDARRRLERNLHDGAQQQLVALKIKMGIARTMAQRDEADQVAALLDQLTTEADDAIDTLRDLARGIYPPLLASEGLGVALASQASKAALPVTVEAGAIGRYPQELEAAVYFCCLEALQNIAKYADADAATIELSHVGDELTFTVRDDGCGFDAHTAPGSGLVNMFDRVDALGGSLHVDTAPGRGCTITGTLPITAESVSVATDESPHALPVGAPVVGATPVAAATGPRSARPSSRPRPIRRPQRPPRDRQPPGPGDP